MNYSTLHIYRLFFIFTYDNNGNRLTMYDSRLTLGDKTFRWEYDELNRVTKETYPDGNYLQYTYDSLGRRSQLRDPDGNLTTYNYNATTLRRD